MAELVRLGAGHAKAVLAFEVENRAFFARSISDRGDAYFERFAEGFDALLAEQAAGVCVFSVLIDDDGSVLGRFNMVDIEDGSAVLGYRVAERATGRGVATAAVRELCEVARVQFGLRSLRAAVAHTNAASQRVLVKAGFVLVGPADPADIGGNEGVWFRRDLLSEAS
ncbi:MAG: GNAT family N-acetyltransferase [Catenulispora sp.]|nr:GNAT family N-acetyltransferase [Catenulispora sp.]